MALTFNNTNIPPGSTVKFNSTALDDIKFGSTLVWKRQMELFVDGATAESGAWTGYAANIGTKPTIGTAISFPVTTTNTSFGVLASCAMPVALNGEHTLSFDMTQCSYTLYDTNLAIEAKWGVRVYALFSKSKITLDSSVFDAVDWATEQDAYKLVCDGYVTYIMATDGSDKSGSISAGKKTANINLTGDYYFGLLVAGYDASTSAFTVNNIIIT